VAPGTSPAIATDGDNGWRLAFHACGDGLWMADPSHAWDTHQVMAPDTNPAVAAVQAASSDTPGRVPFTHPLSWEGWSNLPTTIAAGDCRLEGQNQTPNAQVRLTERGDGLGYDVTWSAVLYTVNSLFGDVWHATFVFRDLNESEVFRVHLDGPEMHKNEIHTVVLQTTAAITQAQFDSIAFVDWIGDC